MPLTPAIVARAANTSDGPAPGKWTVVSAKSDGVTPGFTIRDAANQLWFVKFDPPGWRAMATGSEIVAAKLFWAAGYHTAEYHIAPAGAGESRDRQGHAHHAAGRNGAGRCTRATSSWLLSRADRDPDGSYRVILSKATPGRPVGRIRFHGTRADDPNDVVAARAPPRAARLFRVRGVAQPRRRERHQLAVDVDHRERPQLHPPLPARLRFGAGQRRRRPARRLGRLRSARRTTRRDRQARAVVRVQGAGVAHAGLFRIAGDRPPAARSLRSGIPKRGGRTSPTPRSATCARTTRSGRRRSWPRSPTT